MFFWFTKYVKKIKSIKCYVDLSGIMLTYSSGTGKSSHLGRHLQELTYKQTLEPSSVKTLARPNVKSNLLSLSLQIMASISVFPLE